MPTAKNHIIKSKKNEEFVNALSDKYSDWKVTGLFYSGLHYINAYVHVKYKVEDDKIDRHYKLKDYLDDVNQDDLKDAYIKFQKESHIARYDFKDMSCRVQVAQVRLNQIKKLCQLNKV